MPRLGERNVGVRSVCQVWPTPAARGLVVDSAPRSCYPPFVALLTPDDFERIENEGADWLCQDDLQSLLDTCREFARQIVDLQGDLRLCRTRVDVVIKQRKACIERCGALERALLNKATVAIHTVRDDPGWKP